MRKNIYLQGIRILAMLMFIQSERAQTALHHTATESSKATELIKTGTHKWTPLHKAAYRNDLKEVRRLLIAGAHANVISENVTLICANATTIELLHAMVLESQVQLKVTPLDLALEGYTVYRRTGSKDEVAQAREIIHMLLLMNGKDNVSVRGQKLLSQYSLDINEPTAKQEVTITLTCCCMPTVLINLVFEYYDSPETREFVLQQASKQKSWILCRPQHMYKQGCIVQ